MVFSGNEIILELKEKGYTNLPFPISKTNIQNAINAFFKFLEEDKAIKEYIDFSIAPLHRRGDVGFKRRFAEDHIYNDDKAFFHFHPAIFKQYSDYLKAHDFLRHFMEILKPIWELVSDTIYAVLKSLEINYPGSVDKVFKTDYPHILLRLLRYDWQTSGRYLAKPHYDAGALTLAIAESAPGLRIGRNNHDLKEVVHREGEAIFMLSSNYEKIIKNDELFPAWHDVIQVDETKVGSPHARWALVAFIEAHGVEAQPRSRTHQWVQEGLIASS